MLSGKKPLAMFYDRADVAEEDSVIPYSDFEPYVRQGRFVKGVEIFESRLTPQEARRERIKFVLYAVSGEEWRIPAMLLVIRTTLRTTVLPDEGLMRMESALLGYTDEESDAYHARWRSSLAEWIKK